MMNQRNIFARLGSTAAALLAVFIMAAPIPAGAYVLQGTSPGSRLTMTLAMQSLIGNLPVSDAMAQWNATGIGPGLDHGFFIAQTGGTSGSCGRNQVNEVTWSGTNCGMAFGSSTLAVTTSWSSSGKVIEVDMLFNNAKTWSSYTGNLRFNADGSSLNDLGRVALHELGHAAGLDHPDDAGQTVASVMNSHISSTYTLQADDIAGAHAIAWQSGSAGATPVCSLSASPASITAGASSTLMASCTPAATSYTWTGTGFSSTSSGGVVSPSATTTYSVRGTNASGGGNTASTTVSVVAVALIADLDVPVFTAPTSGVAGSTVTVSVTARNKGTLAAQAFRVGFYLSSDSNINLSDLLIGTCAYSSGLAAGQSSACNMTITLPATLTPGTYFLGAIADDVSAINESDNTNNAKLASTGSIAVSAATVVAPVTPVGTAPNYGDLWWAGSAENGWGMSIQQHGNGLFTALYIYDGAGRPVWCVMPEGTWNSNFTTYTGLLYQPTSSPLSSYTPSTFVPGAAVGSVTLNFTSTSTAVMQYTLNGASGQKLIQRQVFGFGSAPLNVGDMWWGGTTQNGWGISLSQQGSIVFGAWYTYGADGRVTWYVMPNGSWNGTTYSGAFYSTTSSAWAGASYDPNRLAITQAGTMSIAFSGASNAVMTYTFTAGPFAGISQSKAIVRQAY